MPKTYFQTTQDLLDQSPYILIYSKTINLALADNLFCKKLYETPKKDIPALINYHYRRCDEPSEFANRVIELELPEVSKTAPMNSKDLAYSCRYFRAVQRK